MTLNSCINIINPNFVRMMLIQNQYLLLFQKEEKLQSIKFPT